MPEESAAFISVRPRISIAGSNRADIGESLVETTVEQPLCGSAHAEVRLINWGPLEGQQQPGFRFTDLRLGQTLDLFMGDNSESPVFEGEITAIEERYGDGAPQLVLLAQDKLHHLGRERHSRTFDDQSLDDVAQALAQEANLQCNANISSSSATWHQLNESNLAFLMRLTRPLDILPRLQGGQLRVRPEEQDSNPHSVQVGNNALKLRIIADLNRQPNSAESRGFDPSSDESVSHEADGLQPAPSGETAGDNISRLGWPGEESFPAPFVINQSQAESHATGRFKQRARKFLDGDLVCNGEPTLRSGREVELQEVSPRLQGRYLISHCIHRFNAEEGYKTRLRINRSFIGDSS